jgi:hypothetical protein
LTADRAFVEVSDRLRVDYLNCPSTNQRLKDNLWHVGYLLSTRFIDAYTSLLSHLPEWASKRQQQPQCASCFCRLFAHREMAYRFRLFRHEEWVANTWLDIHKHFRLACDLQLEGINTELKSSKIAGNIETTIVGEYLRLLLLKLCFNGSLTDVQIEMLTAQLHDGSNMLHLTIRPTVESGFYVDLSQAQGLKFRNKSTLDGHFLYLDTSPLCDRFKALLASAEERIKNTTDETALKELNHRIAIFKSASARVDPEFKPMLRQSPRSEDRSRIYVGLGLNTILSTITQAQSKKQNPNPDTDVYHPVTQIPLYGFQQNHARTLNAANSAALQIWDLRDRSDIGYRCLLNGNDELTGQLKLGNLICVNDESMSEWQICIITRIMKMAAGRIECGLKVISREMFSGEIRRFRVGASNEAGVLINGENQSRLTSASDALFLKTAFLNTPILQPTVIMKTADFNPRSRYQMTNHRHTQIIELSEVIQEEDTWVWCSYLIKQII